MDSPSEAENLALPCRVFLEAQFHSLGKGVDFGMEDNGSLPNKFYRFPKKGMPEVCQIMGVQSPDDLPPLFSSKESCRKKAESLTPAELVAILDVLSSERWRHVPKLLRRHGNVGWQQREFTIGELVAAAGDLPNVKLNKCTFKELVSDEAIVEELTAKDSYRGLDQPAEVFFDTFVGIPFPTRDGKHILVDGNHRAMHLARQIILGNNPEKKLKVIVPDDRGKEVV